MTPEELRHAARQWETAAGIDFEVAVAYLRAMENGLPPQCIWVCRDPNCDSAFKSSVELCPVCGHSNAHLYVDEFDRPILADSARGAKLCDDLNLTDPEEA